MNAEEAADFLRLSENAFHKLAPTLPRCKIYERSGYRYLRADLLQWLRGRADSNLDSNPAAVGGIQTQKQAPSRKVTRLA
jgi:hypothetical protein